MDVLVASEASHKQININENQLETIIKKYLSEGSILQWSKEGLLDLATAIKLYNGSGRRWLEPMKDIQFIFKNPKLLLSIKDNKIIDVTHNLELTDTANKTRAVLMAMRIAYVKANLSTLVLDHYLSGTSLSITASSSKEMHYFIQRIITPLSSIPVMGSTTPLHLAAAKGNLQQVQQY